MAHITTGLCAKDIVHSQALETTKTATYITDNGKITVVTVGEYTKTKKMATDMQECGNKTKKVDSVNRQLPYMYTKVIF